jgi:adenine deaminase
VPDCAACAVDPSISRSGGSKVRYGERVEAFVQGLPKAELHLHIEGTLEPELKLELARRNGISLPYGTAEEIRAAYSFHDLTSFLVGYYDGMNVMRVEEDFYDLAMAYLRKASSQGVRYAEIFFDPQAHTSRGVPFPVVIGGLRRALVDGRRSLGIRTELIMCFLRDFSAEYAMATLMEALPYKDWILGVGLDSDERDNPPVKFEKVFARARAEGFFLTMHCDVDQQNTTEHLRQVLEVIGVDRIDHGVNVLDSPALVSAVAERGIGFTVCPVSNGFVTSGTKAAEVKRMLSLGLKPTLNSDDPAYFAGRYVADNYLAVADVLSREELVQLARNSFEIAWLPDSARHGFLAEIDAYLGTFDADA